MLRVAVVLLLLANAAFFAWARGWLAPALPPPLSAEREPQRLANQLRPQAVTVLPPQAAAAAIGAARAAAAACLQSGALAEADVGAAEAALASAQVPDGAWTRETMPPPPPWLVYAGRWPDPAALRARQAELAQLGLPVEALEAPPELAPGLVLSRHADRAQADAALAALQAGTAAGVKGLRVLALPAALPRLVLRLPRVDAEQQARLLALPPQAVGGGFRPCAAAP